MRDRSLRLRAERLTELHPGQLDSVVGGSVTTPTFGCVLRTFLATITSAVAVGTEETFTCV